MSNYFDYLNPQSHEGVRDINLQHLIHNCKYIKNKKRIHFIALVWFGLACSFCLMAHQPVVEKYLTKAREGELFVNVLVDIIDL